MKLTLTVTQKPRSEKVYRRIPWIDTITWILKAKHKFRQKRTIQERWIFTKYLDSWVRVIGEAFLSGGGVDFA
jgi:hypothetical protein